jgi:hypothetical protein
MSAVLDTPRWRQLGQLDLLVSPTGRVLARMERAGNWWAVFRGHEVHPLAYRVSEQGARDAAEAIAREAA